MAKALNMDGSDINGKVNKKIISKTLGKVTGKTTGKVWDYGVNKLIKPTVIAGGE